MNGCGPSCGHCGRCSKAPWNFPDERRHPDPCDWCDKLIWPGDELIANHGGRFCSDECAGLWAEDYAAYREVVHD